MIGYENIVPFDQPRDHALFCAYMAGTMLDTARDWANRAKEREPRSPEKRRACGYARDWVMRSRKWMRRAYEFHALPALSDDTRRNILLHGVRQQMADAAAHGIGYPTDTNSE